MVTAPVIADILRCAKQRIVDRGWRSDYENHGAQHGVCAAMAISDAWAAGFWAPGCDNDVFAIALHAFIDNAGLPRRHPASPTSDIILWNDTAGRTKAEVLDAFDRAIERLKGEAH